MLSGICFPCGTLDTAQPHPWPDVSVEAGSGAAEMPRAGGGLCGARGCAAGGAESRRGSLWGAGATAALA